MMPLVDYLVIGAGMAGTSAAAELSKIGSVTLIEAEEYPGYHSTGRSAALFSEIYGNATIRALSRASRHHLFDAGSAPFAQNPLVHCRGTLFLAKAQQLDSLRSFAALPDVAASTRLLDRSQMKELCPLLRDEYTAGGLHEAGSVDIDVHEMQSAYLRQFRSNGGAILTCAPAHSITRIGDIWEVAAGDHRLSASVLVNAAGAWADQVANIAGVPAIGVQPYRRTAALMDPPRDVDIRAWPLLIDVAETFYIKPDAGSLLLSPADETPVHAHDVHPEEIDVAVAAHRAEAAFDFEVRRIKRSWAGLRSFTADRAPVVGFDPGVTGFFWLAGQGGYGIQTAPALARLTAALASGQPLPDDLAAYGVNRADLAPDRFRR